MAESFTVTLLPTFASEGVVNGAAAAVKRDIWLRSTSPFVIGQTSDIALEKVHDNDPNGKDPFAEKLSFAIAIGDESAQAPEHPKEDILFPAATIRLDMETGRPFLWGGTGAKAIKGSAYAVSFTKDNDIVSSLSAGDHIFVKITVGVEVDPESSDLEQSPGIQRASPLVLGVVSRLAGRLGAISGILGPAKNVVPKDTPDVNMDGEPRRVKIGWHPVCGGIGRFLNNFGSFPRKAQHWAVFVGDYYHELSSDDKLNILYQNANVGDEDFELEDVGYTNFNNQAIVDAGFTAIKQMDPEYRLVDNNCQKFAINLLNQICLVGRVRLDTSYAPAQSRVLPEPKFNTETMRFEEVNTAATVVEEKPPVTTVYTEWYYSRLVPSGSQLLDVNARLTEEERMKLLDRAAKLMEDPVVDNVDKIADDDEFSGVSWLGEY